ncbi:MAG: hypothetical protein ACI4I9_00915 [Porcipelethomonas sp.]
MTKKHIVYMILASASVSAVIIIAAGTITVKERKNYYAQELLATEPVSETIPVIGYYLKAYDGELAVFRGDSETPYRRLDVSLSLMSEYDRSALEKGIYAENESVLNRLIEDYTS